MAIYDNDGTANYEIGKLYDNDGTANHQIGKVYDWDGTANNLIYSGTPEYLYKDGDQAVGDTGGWVGVTEGIFWYSSSSGVIDSSAWDASPNRAQAPTFADTYINLYENGQNTYRGCTVRTANAIDITDIASLVFTFYDDLPSSGSTLRYNVVTAALCSDTTPTIVTGYRLNVRSDGTHTITLDTSASSGEYYIYFGNSTGDGHSMTTQLQTIKVNATT